LKRELKEDQETGKKSKKIPGESVREGGTGVKKKGEGFRRKKGGKRTDNHRDHKQQMGGKKRCICSRKSTKKASTMRPGEKKTAPDAD